MMNNKEDNMKYNTRPIDYTGCHPVIAEHLKRGEAIECLVWDGQLEGKVVGFVAGYCASNKYPYRCDEAGVSAWMCAEPIPRKVRRIMPPERAIPVLIAEGWVFTSTGYLSGPTCILVPQMYALMGGNVDGEARNFAWPDCIIEECDE